MSTKNGDKIKRKSVGFDTTDPLQNKLLKIADDKNNFSDYVRTLMIADMLLDGALSDLSIVQQMKAKINTDDFKIEL